MVTHEENINEVVNECSQKYKAGNSIQKTIKKDAGNGPVHLQMRKPFCVLPWTGVCIEQRGIVAPCTLYDNKDGGLGNYNSESITDILSNDAAVNLRKQFLSGQWPAHCRRCSEVVTGHSAAESSTRDNQAMADKFVELNQTSFSHIKYLDLRTESTCNLGCVYCVPGVSSFLTKESNSPILPLPKEKRLQAILELPFDKITNVLMGGGEPLLMSSNVIILKKLLKEAPRCGITVTSGLNTINTAVYELLSQFSNVYWSVSVEATHQQYEYIRFNARWETLKANLLELRKLPHHISIHSTINVLALPRFIKAISEFKQLGFSDSEIQIHKVEFPKLDIRNLPEEYLRTKQHELQEGKRAGTLPGAVDTIIHLIDQPFNKNPNAVLQYMAEVDQRRHLDSRTLFPEIYSLIEVQ